MKLNIWFASFFVSAAFLAVVMTETAPKPTTAAPTHVSGVFDPLEIIRYLEDQRAQPGIDDFRRTELQRTIEKVRHKAGLIDATKRRQPGQENPGLLIEAFAQIKTGADGRTYGPNYRVREYRKAEAAKRKKREPLPWVERGPGNVSGRARAIVVDAADASGNTWFIATIGGGIWKTSDAGQSWESKTPNFTSLATSCLVQSSSNPDVFYAGTGMGYGRVVELIGAGIWKSTDHGETWFQLESTANGELLQAINRIVVDPNDENLVLACSNDSFSHLGPKGGERKSGIFRSTDGGQTWTQVYDADAALGTATDNRVQQIIADPSNFNNLYASVNEVGVIKSVDGGLTWTVSADNFALPSDVGNPTNAGTGLAGISVRTELAISPTDPNRLYAAVERPRGIADLYMTTDAGATWVVLVDTGNDPNWFNNLGQSGANGAYTAGWFDNTIVVDPFDPNVVFLGGVNIYRANVDPTTNQRVTFPITFWIPNQFGLPVVHADQHWLTTIPNPADGTYRILNANDGGVAHSPDGGASWQQITGQTSTQFYGVDKAPGMNAYIGGMQDNGTFFSGADPNAQSPWFPAIGGDGFEAVWHGENPSLLLGGSQFNGLARSTDGGLTWSPLAGGAITGFPPFITKLASSKQDPDLVFIIGTAGIGRSDDFGSTWTLTPMSGNWLGYRPFANVEVANASPHVVWATSRISLDPPTGGRGGVHVSTDSGLSYQEVTANLPAENLTESSGLATHPADPNTAYLLFSAPGAAKILRTTNLGQTWTDLSGFANGDGTSSNGFPDVAVFTLLVMPHDDQILWAGTEIGLFVSEDGGASWELSDSGMPQVAIFELSLVEGQILAATQGRGIWTLDLPELAGYRPPEAVLTPRLTAVAQNPNGTVTVKFDLRSTYDQTQIIRDGTVISTLTSNDPGIGKTLSFPIEAGGNLSFRIVATKDGQTFSSPTKQLSVTVADTRGNYATDFEDPASAADFIGTAFSVTTATGFTGSALHSPHPYPVGVDVIHQLAFPLVVPAEDATLTYDDIAVLEPGAGNGVFGNPLFFDFAVVEATRDGINWKPLSAGYDARFNSAWLNAFNTGTPPDSSMFVSHEIDVHDTFLPGEVIHVRFRLHSDPGLVGWGWVVDNVRIFGENVEPVQLTRRLLYPWISNSDDFESILIANNHGDTPAEVSFLAQREGGDQLTAGPFTIEPRGFLRRGAGELFTDFQGPPGYSVTLSTTATQVRGRWVTNNKLSATGKSPSQGVAVDITAGTDHERKGRQVVFGYLPRTPGTTAAPVIVNTGDAATDVTLRWFDREGRPLQALVSTIAGLAPGMPYARAVNELVSEGTDEVYLIAETADQPLTGTVFVFNDQRETAMGNVTALTANDGSASDLLLPWVSSATDFDSIVIVNNPGDASANLTLSAVNRAGDTASATATVAANGFFGAVAGDLFPELHDRGGFSVRIQSQSSGLQARWVTNNLEAASGRSPSQGVAANLATIGSSANKRAGQALLLGFLPTSEGLTSAPVVVNVSSQPTNVTLYFYSQDGGLVKTDTATLRNLAPMQPFAAVVNDLIGSDEDLYVVAVSDSGPIAGVAFIFNDGNEPAIGNATVIDFAP